MVLLALSAAAPMAVSGAVDEELAPIELVAAQKSYRLTATQLRNAVETFNRERSAYAPHATLAFESQRALRANMAAGVIRRRAEVILSPDRRSFRLPTYRKDFTREVRFRMALQ
jgi:hypothetical protein